MYHNWLRPKCEPPTCTCTCNIVVLWFLQCKRFVSHDGSMYIQHEGGAIPCIAKTMIELTCTGVCV